MTLVTSFPQNEYTAPLDGRDFERWVVRNQSVLNRMARRFTLPRGCDYEDLIQAAVLVLWMKLSLYDPHHASGTPFDAWAWLICKRSMTDEVQKLRWEKSRTFEGRPAKRQVKDENGRVTGYEETGRRMNQYVPGRSLSNDDLSTLETASEDGEYIHAVSSEVPTDDPWEAVDDVLLVRERWHTLSELQKTVFILREAGYDPQEAADYLDRSYKSIVRAYGEAASKLRDGPLHAQRKAQEARDSRARRKAHESSGRK